MKVYLITSGSYSDYGVDKVFLDLKKAQSYVKYHKYSNIETYETSDEEYEEVSGFYYVNIVYEIIQDADNFYHSILTAKNCTLYATTEQSAAHKEFAVMDPKNKGPLSPIIVKVARRYDDRHYSEQEAIDHAKRVAQDLCAQVTSILAAGAPFQETKDALIESKVLYIED